MSNLLLVIMFLLFTLPGILLNAFYFALAFIFYGAVFGFLEFLAKFYTSKTVSQQIIALIKDHKVRGYLLLASMLTGCVLWIMHFYYIGFVSTALAILSFVLLVATSIIDKEYFLTLCFMIFVLSIGFSDSISLQQTGTTFEQHIKSLVLVHPVKASIILSSVVLGWLCLLAHLGIRFKK